MKTKKKLHLLLLKMIPNNITNEDTSSKKEVRDVDDHTTVKHPGRMPGRR